MRLLVDLGLGGRILQSCIVAVEDNQIEITV